MARQPASGGESLEEGPLEAGERATSGLQSPSSSTLPRSRR